MSNVIKIKHRVNLLKDLEQLPVEWGAEIDLRSDVNQPGKIHLSHDAWKFGDDFEIWLDIFSQRKIQGPIVINTKEDGLEERCQQLLYQKGIQNYFFLDTTTPTLVKLGKNSRKNFCVRHSKYENSELCNSLKEFAQWVWVDCFDQKPLKLTSVQFLKEQGFKICTVSPELQKGCHKQLPLFTELFQVSDAICTKFF